MQKRKVSGAANLALFFLHQGCFCILQEESYDESKYHGTRKVLADKNELYPGKEWRILM